MPFQLHLVPRRLQFLIYIAFIFKFFFLTCIFCRLVIFFLFKLVCELLMSAIHAFYIPTRICFLNLVHLVPIRNFSQMSRLNIFKNIFLKKETKFFVVIITATLGWIFRLVRNTVFEICFVPLIMSSICIKKPPQISGCKN